MLIVEAGRRAGDGLVSSRIMQARAEYGGFLKPHVVDAPGAYTPYRNIGDSVGDGDYPGCLFSFVAHFYPGELKRQDARVEFAVGLISGTGI